MGSGESARRGDGGRFAALVATGILLSRIAGLVRQRVLAHYLGPVRRGRRLPAAFRIPNFLQNLLGEGVLSASFIPVYARLLAEGEPRGGVARRGRGRHAARAGRPRSSRSVGVLEHALARSTCSRPGFEGAKRELTIRLVRILFPGVGLLVLSAWCLGVLNSHRRFLLSYVSPVAVERGASSPPWWRSAGRRRRRRSGRRWRVGGGHRQRRCSSSSSCRRCSALVGRPATVARGRVRGRARPCCGTSSRCSSDAAVLQISAYVDTLLASLLPARRGHRDVNAQTLYMLPVSLFGMSVSAAELPEMSSARGDESTIAAACARRLDGGLRRVAFFVVPSAVAFVALGDILASALFQTGTLHQRRHHLRLEHPRRLGHRAVSPRRSAVSMRRRSTRCATRGRRSASRSCAWR